MWTDGNGFFYEGDCRVGDREATPDEVSTWIAANTPSPDIAVKNQIKSVSDQMMASGAFGLLTYDLLQRALAEAKAVGLQQTPPIDVTEAMLTTVGSPLYNENYAKLKVYYDQIAALRSQL